MPARFWADAIQTAIFLINRTPFITVLKGKSSYYVLYGYPFHDLQLLKIFGCLSYPDLQNITDHKLSP